MMEEEVDERKELVFPSNLMQAEDTRELLQWLAREKSIYMMVLKNGTISFDAVWLVQISWIDVIDPKTDTKSRTARFCHIFC